MHIIDVLTPIFNVAGFIVLSCGQKKRAWKNVSSFSVQKEEISSITVC